MQSGEDRQHSLARAVPAPFGTGGPGSAGGEVQPERVLVGPLDVQYGSPGQFPHHLPGQGIRASVRPGAHPLLPLTFHSAATFQEVQKA